MECMVCGKELRKRQRRFCSDKCRKRAKRQELQAPVSSVTPELGQSRTITPPESGQVSDLKQTRTVLHKGSAMPITLATVKTDRLGYQHYLDNPSMYVRRLEPERLNWGKWMNVEELAKAGLKANRVAIPGDWDCHGIHTAQLAPESANVTQAALPIGWPYQA